MPPIDWPGVGLLQERKIAMFQKPQRVFAALLIFACIGHAHAQTIPQTGGKSTPKAADSSPPKAADASAANVYDIPTRQGVTDRVLVIAPSDPKAAVILFAGGNGGLQITPTGTFKLAGNFLIRTRQMFVDQGFVTVIIDAPSDRQSAPFLIGFRTTPQNVADMKAVIGWVKKQFKLPVWLVATSRGTQSAAYVATALTGADGPDGLVLTSSILNDNKEAAVPSMALNRVRIPVLIVHHTQDGCSKCPYSDVAAMLAKFTAAPKKQLIPISGGQSTGDPCEAWAHHGFNGNEQEVVTQIANWILAK
jgi:pimeloyl-ACP methyl ester carboxylesterase